MLREHICLFTTFKGQQKYTKRFFKDWKYFKDPFLGELEIIRLFSTWDTRDTFMVCMNQQSIAWHWLQKEKLLQITQNFKPALESKF